MARDPDGAPRDLDERGPKHRIWEGDYGWYIHPLTEERFLSVTTALEQIRKEDLDLRWRPSLSAEAALRELPRLVTATLTPDCGQTNGRCSRRDTRQHDWRERCVNCPCDRCPRCVVKYLTYEHYRESARHVRRGSAFHNWAEDLVSFGFNTAKAWQKFRDDTHRTILRATEREPLPSEVDELVDLVAPYADGFLRFVDDFHLEPDQWLLAEATVLNRTDGWGGTLDGQLQISAHSGGKSLELCERVGLTNPVVNYDTKTREKDDAAFWFDHSLQQAGYRRGEVVLFDDGTESPLNPVDGAMVVQVRPNTYGWRLVVTDEAAYAAFLGALAVTRWMVTDAAKSTQVKTHPRVPLVGVSPPPKKRAPRKTAAARPVGPDVDATEVGGVPIVDVQLPIPPVLPQSATLGSLRPGRYEALLDSEIPF